MGSPATVDCQAAVALGSSASLISSVSFYLLTNGTSTLLQTDTTAPYTAQATDLGDGSYAFVAVVINDMNEIAISPTNRITVSSIVSGTVTRGPYLGSRGETNIAIRWRTTETTVGRVRYGTNPAALTSFADDTVSRTDHSVALTGLQPETKYYYSIGTTVGTIQASEAFNFKTAPPIGAIRNTRIWFLSDYGQNGDSTQLAVRNAFTNRIATEGRSADLWITGGDNEQSGLTGADSAFQTSVFNVYSNIMLSTPFFPCPGNHDGGAASAYWNNFDLPSQGQAGGTASGNAHYFSFDYANVHFISMDSFNTSTDVGGPMYNWLTNDLAKNTQSWTIAYWHAPVYCKVFYDSDTAAQLVAMRQNFAPVLESYGVDLVLNGHSHVEQRTYLLNQHYGIGSTLSPTNIVDGGSGREDGTGAYLKPNGRGTVYVVAPTGCSMTRNGALHPACYTMVNNEAGSIIVDVISNRLDFKMITSSGAVGEYFTILKGASQSAPPAAPAGLVATGSGSSISLNWTNNSTNEAGYSLERSVNGAAFVEIARPGANLTGSTNTGVDLSNAYYYRLRAWNNAGYSMYSTTVSVTPTGALAFDHQPDSLTNSAGTAATFYALVRGSGPMSWQWYHDGVSLPGQTNNTLTLGSISIADAGHYTVAVSNGGAPLTSDAAALVVISTDIQPVVAVAPQMSGGVFSVGFRGLPGTNYTVQSVDVLGGTWVNRTNVTTPADAIIVIQDAITNSPQRYYRLVYPAQ